MAALAILTKINLKRTLCQFGIAVSPSGTHMPSLRQQLQVQYRYSLTCVASDWSEFFLIDIDETDSSDTTATSSHFVKMATVVMLQHAV